MHRNTREELPGVELASFDDLSMLLTCALIVALALAHFDTVKSLVEYPWGDKKRVPNAPELVVAAAADGFSVSLDGTELQLQCSTEGCSDEVWDPVLVQLDGLLDGQVGERSEGKPPEIYVRIPGEVPFSAYMGIKKQIRRLAVRRGHRVGLGVLVQSGA